MKGIDLKIGSMVLIRKNGEKVPGIIVNKGTHKADVATEQELDNVDSYLKTDAICYQNILSILK